VSRCVQNTRRIERKTLLSLRLALCMRPRRIQGRRGPVNVSNWLRVELRQLLLQLLHFMLDVGALGSDRLTLGCLLLRFDSLLLKVCNLLQTGVGHNIVVSHGHRLHRCASIYRRMEAATTALRRFAPRAKFDNLICSPDFVWRFQCLLECIIHKK
jgi:hypothetical protein